MLVIGCYFAAALIGSLIPANSNWRPPIKGTTLYLYDNGVHTSVIFRRALNKNVDLGVIVADFPIVPTVVDNNFEGSPPIAAKIIPPYRFPGDIEEFPYIMVGWGDAQFYRETPTWGHVRPDTALSALKGSGKQLMHVDRLRHIPQRNVKKLVLRDDEFTRLIDFVSVHFRPSIGQMPLVETGYGPDDRFYPIGNDAPDLRYSAIFTCNNWINLALQQSGIKTGYWTPLPFGLMWWY